MKKALKEIGISLMWLVVFGFLGYICYKMYERGTYLFHDGTSADDDTAQILLAFGIIGEVVAFLGVALIIADAAEHIAMRIRRRCAPS